MLEEDEDKFNKSFLKLLAPYILVIFLFNFLEWIAIYETIYFSQYVGLSLIVISAIFGISALSRLIVEIPTWLLGDTIGNKFNIVVAAILLAIGFWLVFVGQLWSIVLWMVLIAIADGFWVSSLNASAIEYIKFNWHYHIDKFFTLKNIVVSIGYLTGIAVNMFLIKIFWLKYIYIVAAGISIILLIVSILFLPKDNVKSQVKNINFRQSIDVLKSWLRQIKVNNVLYFIAIAMFVLSIWIEGFYNFVYLFFNEVGKIEVENVWWISFVDVFISFFIPIVALWIFKIFDKKFSLLVFLFLSGISVVVLGYMLDFRLQLIFYSLFFTFLQLYHFTKDILIHENIVWSRNTTESTLNFLESLGEVIGGFTFGLVLYIGGFKLIFVLIWVLFFAIFSLGVWNMLVRDKLFKIYILRKSNIDE